MPVPNAPKIYHILHVDRLESVVADGQLWSDEEMDRRPPVGTTIGMNEIKARRRQNTLRSRPGLRVGQCVPFYFCPRSVMLYLIYCSNHPNLTYRGGQEPILHLEADLHTAVEWADTEGKRWAFTLSNAGAAYFEDRCDLEQLEEVNWEAIAADRWSGSGIDPFLKDSKQAEFLMEGSFPWALVSRIGVYSRKVHEYVREILRQASHQSAVETIRAWYY